MKKRLARKRPTPTITETKLRKIIYEELVERYLMQEGMWDDVRSGLKKLSSYVTKQFKSVASSWAKAIMEHLGKLNKIPDEVKKILQVLKQAMSSTGEKFQLNAELKDAQELGKFSKDQALAVVQQDLEGPVHEKAKAAEVKSEGKYLSSIYVVLSEHTHTASPEVLLEDFGITAVVGVFLGIMGGLPMLFKGLHKLAKVLGADGAAHLFEKAEHVTHHFEQKVIDFAMPDRLAYAVYMGLWKLGVHLTKGDEPLNEIEVKTDDGPKAISQCKNLIFKTLLIYFAIQGITGALHAGASMLGFVEGAASTVKGIELAKGAAEISKLITSAV